MAKLIYAINMSLDGYTEDELGRFGWIAPDDVELHSNVCELVSAFGTCLYGRKMYETMVYWETAPTVGEQPRYLLDFARQWQATEKIVYSKTLAEPRSARTRIERDLIPTRSGSSRQIPGAISMLQVLSSPRRRSRQILSTSSS